MTDRPNPEWIAHLVMRVRDGWHLSKSEQSSIVAELDAVTQERDEVREALRLARMGNEGRVPHQTAAND